MKAFKLLVLAAFLSLIVTGVRVDADDSISGVDGEVKVTGRDAPESSILENLKTKILNLESHVKKQSKDIEDKDKVIATKEEIVREQLERITSLESEMVSLHRKGETDATKQVRKAHARAAELEKKVEKLRKDIDVKINEKELLEVRVADAEKKASEADSKSESLQKTVIELKSKLRKTERALQIAEEEMLKAKFEATSKVKELVEVHGAWLPPWLVIHCNNYKSLLEEKWKVHAKPAVERLKQKVSEKKANVEEWAAPHVQTVKTTWLPVIREQWVIATTKVEPHVQTLSRKTAYLYKVSKDTVTPQINKAWELADPYFQELRKSSKPYIDQIATAARPHVNKVHTSFKPYIQEVVHASGKFLESATVYHRQIQDVVHEKLKSHELTKPLATKELVWFSASALLALPILFLFKICFSTSSKKEVRPTRNGHSRHSRRKGKRVHQEE